MSRFPGSHSFTRLHKQTVQVAQTLSYGRLCQRMHPALKFCFQFLAKLRLTFTRKKTAHSSSVFPWFVFRKQCQEWTTFFDGASNHHSRCQRQEPKWVAFVVEIMVGWKQASKKKMRIASPDVPHWCSFSVCGATKTKQICFCSELGDSFCSFKWC